MSEFKIIETQEEFNERISNRINRLNSQHEEEVSSLKSLNETLQGEVQSLKDTISSNEEKYSNANKTIEELQSKIAKHEIDSVKTKVAMELGIPIELVSKLSGSTEEEIREDAQSLVKFVNKTRVPPLRNTEGNIGNSKDAALKELLQGISE